MVRRYFGAEALIGQEVYLGAEALIGQEVAWCRGSNWSGGTWVQRLSLVRRYLGAEGSDGSGGTWVQRLSLVRRYLGAEALIGQEVPWCRGSKWSEGTLVQRL